MPVAGILMFSSWESADIDCMFAFSQARVTIREIIIIHVYIINGERVCLSCFRSAVPWHSSSQPAPISTAPPQVNDVEKSTAALTLEKREPIVMKYSTKSGKKGSKKGAEDDNERNLVCYVLTVKPVKLQYIRSTVYTMLK